MNSEFVQMFLISKADKLPSNKMESLKREMQYLTIDEEDKLLGLHLKNPLVALLLSLMFGVVGFDRMYIGQIGKGILKLILTLLVFGLMWVVYDYFAIMKKTREINYKKLKKVLKKLNY